MKKQFLIFVLFLSLFISISIPLSVKADNEEFVFLTDEQVRDYYGLKNYSDFYTKTEYFIIFKIGPRINVIRLDEDTTVSFLANNGSLKIKPNKTVQRLQYTTSTNCSSGSISDSGLGTGYSVDEFDFYYTNLPNNVIFDGVDSTPDYDMINALKPKTHSHEWVSTWSSDENSHWHICLNSDGLCDVVSNSEMDGFGAHIYDSDIDTNCNVCGYVRTVIIPHVHQWSDLWNYDNYNHWHHCLNTDGLCDLSFTYEMDSYAAHVFDDDQDTDCNICGFTRTIVPVVPSVPPTPTNTPTPTPTPRPTATPTPTPPPFFPGGPDEDGNWVGYTEFEATTLNFLQDIKGLLTEILWWCKNAVAFLFILIGFESMRIVSAWIKGGTKGARSG